MSTSAGPSTIGIDIGGTSIRASVVDDSGQILDSTRMPTPNSAWALEDSITRSVEKLASRHDVGSVGLAVAGFVTLDRQVVRFAPHLPWVDAPIGRILSDRIGLPVILEHDANAAAWAEYKFGAAVRGRNIVLVAIGTGIGGALLIDGQLYRGSHGVAPEFGHIQVVPNGRGCPCGKQGCWERYCSGTALADTAIEIMATEPEESSALMRAAMVDPDTVTGRRVASAAADGDPIALAAMAEFAQWLGVGLAMISDVFDPDLIVVAGGVSSSGQLYLDAAREHYKALITGAAHRTRARIRIAQLGESAGLIGAADLARAALVN